MSVNRFKGQLGMAFIGSPMSRDQTADIHLYAGPGDEVLIDTFKIKDIVAAVNALPGVTATYTAPAPPLPELPKAIGSTIIAEFQAAAYVRVGPDAWYSPNGNLYSEAEMGGTWLRHATIKEGPGA